jgi:DNA-binding GntR family transcriptional regulator
MAELTKSDIAYLAIKQAVIEQSLTPGTKLPEDMLGGHFGVSRTLIRSALARLAAEGLVEARQKRTATVAQPSLREAKSVFEVRRCLEEEVVRLVIERWQPAMGAALEGHVRQEEQAAQRKQAQVSIRLAGEFHIRLAQMTGNELLERYVSEVVSRCSLILAVYGRPHSSECAINEHRQLIDMLRKGDAKAAIKLMAAHLGGVESRALIDDVAKDESDLGTILGKYSAELERVGKNSVALGAARVKPVARSLAKRAVASKPASTGAPKKRA